MRFFLVGAVILSVLMVPVLSWAADPTGSETIKTAPEAAVNFAWTLIAAFLVFFMQAGFAMVEAGFARAKNTVNILTKNFMDFCMGGLAFWAFGFALMFGGSKLASGLDFGNPWIGFSGFFLSGDSYDVTTIELWLFQMVFAATAATIVSGAMAERTKITAYLAYSFLVSAIIYPIYGHWVWGGGWLSALPFGVGARDFAGSGVVHAVGGLVALAGAAMVGPRLGKYNADGTPNVIPGHNLAYVVLGTFILFFGWFGFNPGSTLAATDLRISVIAANTFLAGIAGAVVALYASLIKTGKADVTQACNGALAGLVGITAPCAYVAPWAAVVVGGVAALVMLWSLGFVERTLHVDDPVGAISVHAAAGLWGLLAVGIFADGTYGGVKGLIVGEVGQLIAQLISVVVVTAWSLATGFLMFWILKRAMGLRASREEEIGGLDLTEHGLEAYPAQLVSFASVAGGQELS
ncbi:MAG: ammonium transporter [Armatimonadota bacterium]|nr:ammonium transporter [Armatimonadota bacterium]MDR5702168.1 ammonium transporter [Armatimonadota bacterium]MDR7433944.1 ammonium transporter [Armatimonadota bacterium]